MTQEFKFLREINLSYRKKRVKTDAPVDVPLTDARQVFDLFEYLQSETKEQLIAISLDARNQVISYELVALGSVNGVSMRPFEIFRSSIVVNATSLILVHNHPSGNPTPSEADKQLTRKINAYGRDGGIQLLDHIIIGDGRYYSFSAQKEFSR